MTLNESPSNDEIEITLLGRGVGECVVVHLLDGEWMVIDSFNNGSIPAARVYLDTLRVDPAAVKTLVVTHFHADHYRGIDRLHDYYSSARLMVTEALRAEQFVALYSDPGEPPILDALPGTIKRAKDRIVGEQTPGLRHVKVGQHVHLSDRVRVLALSPTDAAVLQSNQELHDSIATKNPNVVRSRLRDDNRCSVVLHIQADSICALLGADLVADNPAYGWRAVLDEPTHQSLERATLVKVPHHGGESGHDDAMWDNLVHDDAVLKVAPFWPSAIPRETDIARLCERGQVWQAAPSVGFETDEFGNKVSARPETGVVQARRRVGEDAWRVQVIEPAFAAC